MDKLEQGRACYEASEYEQALAAFEQAILSDPNNAETYVGKGDALGEMGRYEEALAAYEQAIQLDPNNIEAYLGKSQAICSYAYPGDESAHQQALEAADRAIQLDPNNAEAYIARSNALQDLYEYKQAVAACEQAIQLEPDNVDAWLGKSRALWLDGEIDVEDYPMDGASGERAGARLCDSGRQDQCCQARLKGRGVPIGSRCWHA